MLSGCWDILDLQDIQYITAIGIDYEDGEYVVYVQSLNFGHLSVIDTSNSSNENLVHGLVKQKEKRSF